jgi:pilus assembly protein Flp/PilA
MHSEGIRTLILPSTQRKFRKENIDVKKLLMRLWKEEDAQDLIEYALLIALLALAAAVGMKSLGTVLNAEFGKMSTAVTTAT